LFYSNKCQIVSTKNLYRSRIILIRFITNYYKILQHIIAYFDAPLFRLRIQQMRTIHIAANTFLNTSLGYEYVVKIMKLNILETSFFPERTGISNTSSPTRKAEIPCNFRERLHDDDDTGRRKQQHCDSGKKSRRNRSCNMAVFHVGIIFTSGTSRPNTFN